MNTKTINPQIDNPPRSVHRFTIREFERLVRIGFLNPGDRAELIDGWLVDKMPHNPRHAGVVDIANKAIEGLLSKEWTTRSQLPVRLPGDNAPEPDVVVVPAPKQQYIDHHPTENDVALVVEVSDTSLDDDRRLKLPQYARAKIPIYWILNLIDHRVEVYTEPRGGKKPTYKQQTNYGPDDEVPLVLNGKEVGRIPVKELLV
ncbi:MAG TPA: Uma2 family endonuclease [Gemmata sp.]|nr:Uma2 family endonuclease [Gemmata sp.]